VVVNESPRAKHSGTVAYEMCRGNFIGNGSAVLMRKNAIQEAGGYDSSLRARSAEGLEDWLLYFRISTRHQFAVVAEHLTGYRYVDQHVCRYPEDAARPRYRGRGNVPKISGVGRVHRKRPPLLPDALPVFALPASTTGEIRGIYHCACIKGKPNQGCRKHFGHNSAYGDGLYLEQVEKAERTANI